MARFAILAVAVAMLIFASPATAQSTGGTSVEATTPESAGQNQYQYDPDAPSIQQSIEKGIEDAVEDAQESNAATDGTEAYIGALSPEDAEASEAEVPEAESSDTEASEAAPSETEATASARYENLPDTGGPALSLPFAGAFAAFLAGGWLMRRVHTKSE